MDKKNIILIVISIILFIVAIGVVISFFYDTDKIFSKEVEKNLEELIEEKSSVEKPDASKINEEEVEEILNAKTETSGVIGDEDGVTNEEEELVFVGQNEENRNKDSINKEYSDFTVTTLDEEEFVLSSYEGKPMVLMFWRSDVGDAIESLNTLNSAYEKYGEKIDFVCIDVSVEEPSSRKEVKDYLEANNIKVDMYYDVNNDAILSYNVSYVPSVIFMDKNRNVINTKKGVISYDALEANLDLLIGNF